MVSVVTTAVPVPRLSPDDVELSPFESRWAAQRNSPIKNAASTLPFALAVKTDAASYCSSPYHNVSGVEFAETQGKALAQERAFFMDRLQAARRERFMLEHKAALAIQRVHKGYQLRKTFRAIKEKLKVRKRIRVNLVKVTKGTALVLGEKDRRARVLAQQIDAAASIQAGFRLWMARRWLAAERSRRECELKTDMVIVLQTAWRASLARAFTLKARQRRVEQARRVLAAVLGRLYRGYIARQRVRRLRVRRRTFAAQRLQWFVQRTLLAKKARRLAGVRQQLETRHSAAIQIQKLARGAIQRAAVVVKRLAEVAAVREACALSIQRTFRGFLGRQVVRYQRLFAIQARAWVCALHVSRIVRGFLGRRRAAVETRRQEDDLLVQARRGNLATVLDLLDGFNSAGEQQDPADITIVSDRGNSVLHLAAKFGHLEVVTLALPKLREVAADRVYIRNQAGHSALALAVLNGHEQVAMYFLAMTADLFVVSAPIPNAICQDQAGRRRTLLHEAARCGLPSVVAKLLLLFPTEFTGQEEDSWSRRTPLHEALLFENERLAREQTLEIIGSVLETILTKAPRINMDAQDKVGFTALHLAASLGNLPAVKLLLQFSADVAVPDAQERTPWRVALLQGHEACFVEIRQKWLGGMAALDGEDAESGGSSSSSALVDAATRSRRIDHLHPQLEQEALSAYELGDLEKLRFYLDEYRVAVDCTERVQDRLYRLRHAPQ